MSPVWDADAADLDTPASAQPASSLPRSDVSLVDLLDRLLGTGVVLVGDVVISLAGVDLVEVKLQALITSVRSELERAVPTSGGPGS